MRPARPEPTEHWLPFRSVGFKHYWLAVVASSFAVQIQTVAVGWQIYDLTRDPLDLGLIGLSQFLPALLLVLITGTVSDRFQRRTIMSVCLAVEALCAVALLAFTLGRFEDVRIVFATLALLGTARAFYNPARQSIVPNLVAPQHLAQAITINTTPSRLRP